MNFFKGLGEKIETGLEVASNQGRQLLNKVQGVETSKDERFDAAKKVFEQHTSTVEKMLQSVKMQDNGLQALGNGLASMAQHIVAFNGDENRVPGAVELSNSCEALKTNIDVFLDQTRAVEENLKLMVEQLGQVKKHILERDRLLIDFDKARHELASEIKKTEANPGNPALAVVQKRHDERQELYRQRNEEVLREMDEIYRTRNIYTEIQMYVNAMAQFFGNASQQFGQLASKFASIQPPAITSNYRPPAIQQAPAPTPTPIPMAHPAAAQQPYRPPQPTPQQPQAPVPAMKAPPAIKRARALYAFKGETPTELSFQPNDTLVILNTDHPEWWLAELNGVRGEVPSNYVQLL